MHEEFRTEARRGVLGNAVLRVKRGNGKREFYGKLPQRTSIPKELKEIQVDKEEVKRSCIRGENRRERSVDYHLNSKTVKKPD